MARTALLRLTASGRTTAETLAALAATRIVPEPTQADDQVNLTILQASDAGTAGELLYLLNALLPEQCVQMNAPWPRPGFEGVPTQDIAYNYMDIVGATGSTVFMAEMMAEPGYQGYDAATRLAHVIHHLTDAGFQFRLRWDGDDAGGPGVPQPGCLTNLLWWSIAQDTGGHTAGLPTGMASAQAGEHP